MLKYLRMALLVVVVAAGIALPIVNQAWLAWVAGIGFLLVLILSHPAVSGRFDNQD